MYSPSQIFYWAFSNQTHIHASHQSLERMETPFLYILYISPQVETQIIQVDPTLQSMIIRTQSLWIQRKVGIEKDFFLPLS